ARALRTLANRFSGHAMPYGIEPAPIQQNLLDPSAEAAYTAAFLDVEKRIAALEHRQPARAPSPSATETAPSQNTPASSGARAAAPKFRSAPLALAIGTGEALMFLPRDQAAAPPPDSRVAAALGRIGRLFQKGNSRGKRQE